MSQAPETPVQPHSGPPPAYLPRHSRLFQVAAWVVIVAGIVFVVATVFFSGVWAARVTHHGPHHPHGMFAPESPDGPPFFPGPWGQSPPGFGPGGSGGPGWPGPWGPPPGFGPGGPGGHGGHGDRGGSEEPPPPPPSP